jgi:von Willebrand factor type A domain
LILQRTTESTENGMKLVQSALTVALTIAATAGMAAAQTSGNPGMGTGTGGGTGAPTGGGATTPEDLDLPLEKPNYSGPDPEDEEEPPEPPEVPDPSDEDPPLIYGEEIPSENDTIFYVLDISCSMGWDSQSYTTLDGQTRSGPRIDRAKTELSRSVMGLSDNFRFNIVAFDCSTRQWSSGMMEANDSNKSSALNWVRSLSPTGATGTGPATALALNDRENMAVVLLTDGAPNCGASGNDGHRRVISGANQQGASVNVFGIAASGSYRSFCQGVAADNNGSYIDVP